jgi:hypothetical protein
MQISKQISSVVYIWLLFMLFSNNCMLGLGNLMKNCPKNIMFSFLVTLYVYMSPYLYIQMTMTFANLSTFCTNYDLLSYAVYNIHTYRTAKKIFYRGQIHRRNWDKSVQNKHIELEYRGRILGRNWDKSLKSFPLWYTQPTLQTDFTHPLPCAKVV